MLLTLLPATVEIVNAGSWTALSTAPPNGVNHAILLSDGTVLTDNGDGGSNKLTPDIHGGYIHGTWTRVSRMNDSRLFFASAVLTNGNVFVAGGEYGSGGDHAELYDPLNNFWTRIPDPIPGVDFSDAISKILPNGNMLVAPVSKFGGCLIYNVALNTWQTVASTLNQNEVCWVKLANDNIVTIDTGAQTSEHYVPSSNQWIADGNVPVVIYGYGAEIGAGFLLPNGNVFYIGGSTNTAIYTPGATPTSAGSWVAGPPMVFGTNQLGAVDAPAAMMADGKILCALGPVGGFNPPTYFYEYDHIANAFAQVNAPGGGSSYGAAPYATSLLDLPDGSVLFIGGQNTTSLYIYTPGDAPLAAGQPVINSVSENANGSFHLTGTGLNGISEGAAYGDDEQMNSNYPLVRMTNNASGNVYYARTFNWSSTSVQTGGKILTTEFTLPQNLPAGNYSLAAVANGNPSAPTNFIYSPPAIPTGLTAASGSNGFVNLSWNSSAAATAYNVKRANSLGGYYATIATVTGLAFTNGGVTNGLAYYYKAAAVGSGGPSSDSAAASATPAGPTLIPGATQADLAAFYNRTGIFSDGRSFATGVDGGSSAYSGNLLGPAIFWNNLVFNFGPSNAVDVVACAGQTINLPAGRFNTLQLLATGVQGNQAAQNFTVTYTDNSTATFTQSFSDWANPQFYSGENTVITMPYRNQGGGNSQALYVTVDGYIFTLDQTKTVKSITLPMDSNVVILSLLLANDSAPASLSACYNRAGIYTDATTFTNPATGGVDGNGYAYSGSLLGSSQIWTNTIFNFGPLDATNVISGANQTISLPPGNYSRLQMLATAVNGNQPSQSFVVTYTDATTTTFVQGLSDWFTPQNYPGESKAIPMSYRNSSGGSSSQNSTLYLYGYNFALNSSKTVQSIRLPNNANVVVAAISLVPDWEPVFKVNPLFSTRINAGQFFSTTVAPFAGDLNGDSLAYGKVSGPAWLTVGSSGAVSGTPANTDANTNTFIVSVRDSGGFSNTATLYIYVNGAPSFTANPFTMPAITAGGAYSGTIATNAADPNPGDALSFVKISGPSWLTAASDGTLSGTPFSSAVGTNNFVVRVTDPGGLSNTAAMSINVTAAPDIVSSISFQNGNVFLNWSGGIGPYQVQFSTNPAGPDWQDVGGTISGNSLPVTPTNDAAFYRIIGQ